MYIIRPVVRSDLPDLLQLATTAEPGITTFPADEATLTASINRSIHSFEKNVSQPSDEYYFFVMEDTTQHHVVGCSAIEAIVGMQQPYYFYKCSQMTMRADELKVVKKLHFLSSVNDYDGFSELCTLYLHPDYRSHQGGHLLSWSRFLFMANEPHRVADRIIAELRGVSSAEGISPFWQGIGRHFFPMDFLQAVYLTGTGQREFIHDLLPDHPICVELLPEETQAVVGKPHPQTMPAKVLLEQQGFSYQGYMDLFDGGPTLEAFTHQLYTVAKSQLYSILAIENCTSDEDYLLSNVNKPFRACISKVAVDSSQQVTLPIETAKQLMVQQNDVIRMISLRR